MAQDPSKKKNDNANDDNDKDTVLTTGATSGSNTSIAQAQPSVIDKKDGSGNQQAAAIEKNKDDGGDIKPMKLSETEAWLDEFSLSEFGREFAIFETTSNVKQYTKEQFQEFIKAKCSVDHISNPKQFIAFGLAYDALGSIKSGVSDFIVVKLYRICDDPKTKGRIFPIALQRGLAGYIKRCYALKRYACEECGFFSTELACTACFKVADANNVELNTYTEVRLEGTPSSINLVVDQIKAQYGIDLPKSEVHSKLEPKYPSFNLELTEEIIRREDSSGKKSKKLGIRSNSSSSPQFTMKEALFARDGGCRFHGKDCEFCELANLDSFAVGHLSDVNGKNQIEQISKCSLSYNIQNGYLWCRPSEFCWNRDLFSIDAANGKAIFAPEFPFEEMKVDPNDPPTIAYFGDEKDDTCMIDIEPKKALIEARHKIYVHNRKEKYEKHIKLKFECKVCKKRFLMHPDLDLHILHKKHNQSDEVSDFQSRHYYVLSFPVCDCSSCKV